MQYAALHAPSLQGFLHWLELAGAEVKREAEAAGDTVRIMTVHGAKGLEAPLVILPDTVALPPDDARVHWAVRHTKRRGAFSLWAPNKAFPLRRGGSACGPTAAVLRAPRNTIGCSTSRLTRARDHLLICGWEPRGDVAGGKLVRVGGRRACACAGASSATA